MLEITTLQKVSLNIQCILLHLSCYFNYFLEQVNGYLCYYRFFYGSNCVYDILVFSGVAVLNFFAPYIELPSTIICPL
jgi:hypothetical protein